MEIVAMQQEDISELISLAHLTWQHTYTSIISQEQIDYMLNCFYTSEVLTEQMKDPSHFFFGIKEDHRLLGYCHAYLFKEGIKLSKLYINPIKQSKGCGKRLLLHLEHFCREKKLPWIELNVNRHNPAQHFYIKMGFEIIEVVDIPLDKFWLNDYVMKKNIESEL